MQGTLRVYLVSALVAGVVAAATALVTVRLLVGPPMESSPNNSAGSPAAQPSPSTRIEEGTVELRWGGEKEELYKVPFATPPNLTFPDGLAGTRCEVVEQKAGSFKVRRATTGFLNEPGIAKVRWKAEGQPAK